MRKVLKSFNLYGLVLLILDILIFGSSMIIATLTMLGTGAFTLDALKLFTCVSMAVVFLSVFTLFGIYSIAWRYSGIREFIILVFANTVSSIIIFIVLLIRGRVYFNVILMNFMITLFLTVFTRACIRIISRDGINFMRLGKYSADNKKRALIVGSGYTGKLIIDEMLFSKSDYYPIIAVDDDPRKKGLKIHGVKVSGSREDIPSLVEKHMISEIIITMPSASKESVRDIINICSETNCRVKIMKSIRSFINEDISIKNNIKDVDISDLLGRPEVEIITDEIAGYLTDEVVLVTGGGGSIGSELCTQIAKFKPSKLIIFDIFENGAYDLRNQLLKDYGNSLDVIVLIGSVRDQERMLEIFSTYHPSVIFHAAAHKHVPLMEDSPDEAIKNNVYGTYNVASCAHKFGAKRFVLVSTDKAVNPVGIMGASKRMAEMVMQIIGRASQTKFAAVRFGNVLGSNGSVIPLFKRQIEQGGPVTVTSPEMTRFFMTIPEAAQLVMQAGAMANGGRIFILDMGESVKIVDLAETLIRLSGFKPGIDIQIEFTGLRPGEKLYEELLLKADKHEATRHEKIFIEPSASYDYSFLEELDEIRSRLTVVPSLFDDTAKWINHNLSNEMHDISCLFNKYDLQMLAGKNASVG